MARLRTFEMNASSAMKMASGTQERIGEKLKKDLPGFAPTPKSSSKVELPHPANKTAPVLSELLARFEGVARWGLNE